MKDVGIVLGDVEQAVPLVIGGSTVYVHTDIEQLEPDEFGAIVYRYREVQYDKDEYIQMIAKQLEESDALINTILGVT